MKRVARFFENLFFPPRCVGCRRLFQKDIWDPCEVPLCDRCRLSWEREKGEDCPDCGLEMLLCRCCEKTARDAGIFDCIKLVSYKKDQETVGRRGILYLKEHNNQRAFRFFAQQMSFSLQRYMEEKSISPKYAALCYVPRGQKNRNRYGFDHAMRLCACLSEQVDIRMLPELFYRSSGVSSREQKKLSFEERRYHASEAFALDEGQLEEIKDSVKYLFIVDDIMTTGASMSGCVKLLQGKCDASVTAVCIARTAKGRRKSEKVRG